MQAPEVERAAGGREAAGQCGGLGAEPGVGEEGEGQAAVSGGAPADSSRLLRSRTVAVTQSSSRRRCFRARDRHADSRYEIRRRRRRSSADSDSPSPVSVPPPPTSPCAVTMSQSQAGGCRIRSRRTRIRCWTARIRCLSGGRPSLTLKLALKGRGRDGSWSCCGGAFWRRC